MIGYPLCQAVIVVHPQNAGRKAFLIGTIVVPQKNIVAGGASYGYIQTLSS
jgi:hypothetical protein